MLLPIKSTCCTHCDRDAPWPGASGASSRTSGPSAAVSGSMAKARPVASVVMPCSRTIVLCVGIPVAAAGRSRYGTSSPVGSSAVRATKPASVNALRAGWSSSFHAAACSILVLRKLRTYGKAILPKTTPRVMPPARILLGVQPSEDMDKRRAPGNEPGGLTKGRELWVNRRAWSAPRVTGPAFLLAPRLRDSEKVGLPRRSEQAGRSVLKRWRTYAAAPPPIALPLFCFVLFVFVRAPTRRAAWPRRR